MRDIFFFGWMLLMAGGALGQSVPEGAVIIGNEIGVKELTTKEVRQYMRGESSRWKEGSDYSVTVVLPSTKLPECVPTSEFLVNSSRPSSLQKYWLSLVFEGRAKAPVFGQTQDGVLREVMAKPGAIGIVFGMDVPEEYVIAVVPQ